jgi:hypothetical protein
VISDSDARNLSNRYARYEPRQRSPSSLAGVFIGCDLGRADDFSAVVAIEKIGESLLTGGAPDAPWATLGGLRAGRGEALDQPVKLRVRHIERLPPGTPRLTIIGRVRALTPKRSAAARRLVPHYLVVDATGVGLSAVDAFRAARLLPMPVVIGGDDVSYVNGFYRVPKRDLARSVKLLLNKSWLRATNDLPLWGLLKDELGDFAARVSISSGSPWEEAWRDGEYDDLVLAAALACWYALQY